MSIKPFFPDSVWNGLSESRKSFYEDRTPDYMDWDRIVVELQAVITIDTPGSTVEFDLGLTDWHSITLDQDTIFTLLRPMINQLFYIKIFQGSSNWAITWFDTITWFTPTFSEPILPATEGNVILCSFLCTGPGLYDGFVVGASGL